MSKSEFFLNIEALAEEQIAEIQSASQQQSELILKSAKKQAQKLKEVAFLRGKEMADRDRYAYEHRASIEALQLIENAERELLHVLLAGLQEKLGSLRSQPTKYKMVLQEIVHEAVDQLRLLLPVEGNFRVLADPQDQPFLEDILYDYPQLASPEYTISTWGGVIVTNQTGTVLIDNSLEKRLENALPVLTREMLDRFEAVWVEG